VLNAILYEKLKQAQNVQFYNSLFLSSYLAFINIILMFPLIGKKKLQHNRNDFKHLDIPTLTLMNCGNIYLA